MMQNEQEPTSTDQRIFPGEIRFEPPMLRSRTPRTGTWAIPMGVLVTAPTPDYRHVVRMAWSYARSLARIDEIAGMVVAGHTLTRDDLKNPAQALATRLGLTHPTFTAAYKAALAARSLPAWRWPAESITANNRVAYSRFLQSGGEFVPGPVLARAY